MSRASTLSAPVEGGLVLGMSKNARKLYCCTEDTHTLTIGAVRSGKSRGVVLPSICTLALAGESMVVLDAKSELYLYTYPFLERLGYEVIAIDFKNPKKSARFNFLQPVIDAVNEGDTALAATRARDISAMLVPEEDKMERIWLDGERATLTMAILAVVMDNVGHPEFQNLSNVREFITNMCKIGNPNGKLPIELFLSGKPADYPARKALGVSQIAPSKMRGSFYTSAAVCLDLFTDPYIHSMTGATDFDCYATGQRKRAVFIMLPDHKSTYYPLASLFIYQQYQMLVDYSDKHGNRLPRRVNFLCDEFGNFTKINDFDKQFTVGPGRGIRFHLFLQDFHQLDERYGDKVGKIIRANAETWIYLQTDDLDTLRELSEKMGKYTVKSPSLSGSTGGSMSASYNYTGRDLLTADEIKRPYQLVLSRNEPLILYQPDLAGTIFNDLLGLGDKAHNAQVIMQRDKRRAERPAEVRYWGIWDVYARLVSASES